MSWTSLVSLHADDASAIRPRLCRSVQLQIFAQTIELLFRSELWCAKQTHGRFAVLELASDVTNELIPNTPYTKGLSQHNKSDLRFGEKDPIGKFRISSFS